MQQYINLKVRHDDLIQHDYTSKRIPGFGYCQWFLSWQDQEDKKERQKSQ